MSWAQAIPAIVKGGTALYKGISQQRKAKKLREKYGDAEYESPEEYQTLLESRRAELSREGFPGQAELEEQLDEETANIVRQAERASGPNEFLSAVQGAYGRKQDALLDIKKQEAKDYYKRLQLYNQSLQQQAKESEKEWMRNEYMPYRRAMRESSRLSTAGGQNISTGVTELGATASAMAQDPDIGGGGENKSGQANYYSRRKKARRKQKAQSRNTDVQQPSKGESPWSSYGMTKKEYYNMLRSNPEMMKGN